MELNKIYNVDCVEYMKTLPNECVRILKPTGVFYCYGNFDILSKQKVLIFDKQLNFRQNITLSKGLRAIAGRTSDKLRMFPTASEYLLYYVKQDEYFDTPFSRIMKQKLELSKNGNVTGWVHNKLKGIQIPTESQWEKICKLFNIENKHNELVEQYNKERYIFNLPTGITDVWEFIPDKVRYGHKTQKPKDITDRIIRASSNKGDLVYIPFAGSGSEIVSCINNNRNYIATETSKEYIEGIINKRIGEIA